MNEFQLKKRFIIGSANFTQKYGANPTKINNYEIKKILDLAEKNNKTLDELSLVEVRKIYKDLDKGVLKVFDVRNSMNSKTSYGGTASNNTKMMIKKYKKELK